MPPKSQHRRSHDDYAAQRCACGHIVYVPGEPCLAAVAYDPPRCSCTDHHVPVNAKAGGGER